MQPPGPRRTQPGGPVSGRRWQLCRASDALAAQDLVQKAIRPAAAAIVAAVLERARAEERRVGELVPAGARQKLDRILEQPKLVPDRLVREVLESDALDAVMRDVLYDALKEFSEKVNPFFAEWGLPALLKRVAPFGLGAVTKSVGSMRAEFERRLEPEIRKFLQGFSRTAMRDTIEIIVAKGDTPEFIAMRKHVASWALDQAIRDLVGQLDEKSSRLAQEIGLDVAELMLQEPSLARRRREDISAFLAAHGEEPIREVLGRFGITITLDFAVLAAVTWPVVKSLCASAPVQAWIAAVVGEFFDGLPDDLG